MDMIGNQKLIRHLRGAIREGHLAGAYLIEGARGTGKLSAIRRIACDLVSPCAESGNACLSCPSCKRVLSGTHIDVRELVPSEEGKKIQVADVRDMLKQTYVLPSESDWRVFIIPDCSLLRKDSQNALLKSIEEPPERTVFFLLTTDRSLLLPTVRSRSVLLTTEPLSKEEMLPLLEEHGISAEIAETVYPMSGGSLGLALEIAADRGIQELRERTLGYLSACFESASFTKLSLLFPAADTDRNEVKLFLSMIQAALCDLLAVKMGSRRNLSFFSDRKALVPIAAILSEEIALELFDRSLELIAALDLNANVFASLSTFHLTAQKLTQINA